MPFIDQAQLSDDTPTPAATAAMGGRFISESELSDDATPTATATPPSTLTQSTPPEDHFTKLGIDLASIPMPQGGPPPKPKPVDEVERYNDLVTKSRNLLFSQSQQEQELGKSIQSARPWRGIDHLEPESAGSEKLKAANDKAQALLEKR